MSKDSNYNPTVRSTRTLSGLDTLIIHADNALRTLVGKAPLAKRASPAKQAHSSKLDDSSGKRSAALMRVNHTGEVCAQALYQGQILTAKNAGTRQQLQHACDEEMDHLAWCEERIEQLDSHTSYLNPVFYSLSYTLGAATGLLGDKISLGFVHATEKGVHKHLQEHLSKLPEDDLKSRSILQQMAIDEQQHGEQALSAGGTPFPAPVTSAMDMSSRVMKFCTYYI